MVSDKVFEQSMQDKGLLKKNTTPDSVFRQLFALPKESINVLNFKYQTLIVKVRDTSPDNLWGDTNHHNITWGDTTNKGFVWASGFTNPKVVKKVTNYNNVFYDENHVLFDMLIKRVYKE